MPTEANYNRLVDFRVTVRTYRYLMDLTAAVEDTFDRRSQSDL